METGERLSAYLAGELDAAQTSALEGELASDPSLRAQLERIRAANEALDRLPPVSPSAEFSARLRDTLRQDIDQRAAATSSVDELAGRRLQRNAGGNRFVGIGIAAAAVAVVAGVSLSNLFGASDEQLDVASGDTDAAMESAPGAQDPLAPFIRVTDTDHDAESVTALADEDGLLAIPDEVAPDEARELEAHLYPAFGLGADQAAALSSPAGEPGDDGEASDPSVGGTAGGGTNDDETADAPQTAQEDRTTSRSELEAAPADPFTDVRRCLPEIVATANQPVIPLFAEVAAYEGEPAIIYLLLTREPDARLFNRIEVWVVARADCFHLNFQQLER